MPKVTLPHIAPAVSIKKNVYAMSSADGAAAEITLYGDIYEQQPVNPWTGKPVEGQFILLNEFLDDLKQIEGCKSILIRMHSYGGDAGVSNVIHNRLRDLSRNGTKLSCIVDGVAMSGGSLISGSASSPFTLIFANCGKSVPNLRVQNSWISSSEPGAWFANWLQGKSRISKPLSFRSLYISSSGL